MPFDRAIGFPLKRGQLSQFLISGGQLSLVVAVLISHSNAPAWRTPCLLVLALLSLLAWTLVVRRRRAIIDLPVSSIASAAQGYVSLRGKGKPLDPPVCSRLFQVPCLWYRFMVEEKDSDGKWRCVESGESEFGFVLNDGSGECLIDIEGAEIETTHRAVRNEGDYRSTEWSLSINDDIFLLGNFRTLNNTLTLDSEADVKTLLETWKKDPTRLLERFDLDKDGEINMPEWNLARHAARREVEKMHREARQQADTNIVECPRDDQLYFITNRDPAKLARRYLLGSVFHLSVFFSALAAIPWLRAAV